jgi:hypothetical protein
LEHLAYTTPHNSAIVVVKVVVLVDESYLVLVEYEIPCGDLQQYLYFLSLWNDHPFSSASNRFLPESGCDIGG